jgi:hypothetical protein
VDNRCPRCASERYAFLTNWLPSEERRRWRRPPPAADTSPDDSGGVSNTIARWFRGEAPKAETGPLTRASDHVVHLKFDEPEKRKPTRSPRSRRGSIRSLERPRRGAFDPGRFVRSARRGIPLLVAH